MTRSGLTTQPFYSVSSAFVVSSGDAALVAASKTNNRALDARWIDLDAAFRQRRRIHLREGERKQHSHREFYRQRLQEWATNFRKSSVFELLQALSVDYGLSWVDISRMLNVSVPAIRKWRNSGSISPSSISKLADLRAFMEGLSTLGGIESPANWLHIPPIEGYTLIPRDLYETEASAAILDYACGNVTADVLFDELRNDWRNTYKSLYESRIFDDGEVGLVRRTSDDG